MRVQPTGPIELRIASGEAKAFLELERERLKLATAEAERKTQGGGLDPALASILIAVLTLLGAVTGYLVTRRTEIWKVQRTKDLELAFARGTHLLDQRVVKYQILWRTFGYLSRYPLPRGFTVGDIGTLRETLRHWYFDEAGGMFLSEDDGGRPGSRTRYFALQAGLEVLELALESHNKTTRLVQDTDRLCDADAKRDETRYDGFRMEHELPADVAEKLGEQKFFTAYRFMRALGTRLRTALVEDLGSRRPRRDALPAASGPNRPAL